MTCAEDELKIFVPIRCKHSESTIVAVGGIRVNSLASGVLEISCRLRSVGEKKDRLTQELM